MAWEDPRDEPKTAIPSGFDDDQKPARPPNTGRAVLLLVVAVIVPLIAIWILLQLAQGLG
jgi:hypothetical protein